MRDMWEGCLIYNCMSIDLSWIPPFPHHLLPSFVWNIRWLGRQKNRQGCLRFSRTKNDNKFNILCFSRAERIAKGSILRRLPIFVIKFNASFDKSWASLLTKKKMVSLILLRMICKAKSKSTKS